MPTPNPHPTFAADPTRWVVLYNLDSEDLAAWAEHYRAARGIPDANLIGLHCSTQESIDLAEYAALREAVADHLAEHHLESHVMGILAGFGVPGVYDLGSATAPVASSLFDLAGSALFNPLASMTTLTRPDKANTQGLYMTARIDAPNLAAAVALVDRATAISQGAALVSPLTLFLNPVGGGTGPGVSSVNDHMTQWASGLDRQRTRLPLVVHAGDSPLDSVSHDGFLWGWVQTLPPADFFGSPPGGRVFIYPIRTASPTLVSLRDASPTCWAGTALAQGYAAVLASTAPSSVSAVAFVRPFFEALRRGWTLAEAWFVASPVLGSPLTLIGDPLMTVPLPRAGWDVFGPLDRLEALDPETPLAMLREEEHSLVVAEMEEEGAHFIVRRVDAFGRSEAGLSGVRFTPTHTTPPPEPPTPPGDDVPVTPTTPLRLVEG